MTFLNQGTEKLQSIKKVQTEVLLKSVLLYATSDAKSFFRSLLISIACCYKKASVTVISNFLPKNLSGCFDLNNTFIFNRNKNIYKINE